MSRSKVLAVTLATHWARYDPDRVRALYEWLVGRMTRLGAPPNKLGWWTGGPHHPYRDFKRLAAKVKESNFGQGE